VTAAYFSAYTCFMVIWLAGRNTDALYLKLKILKEQSGKGSSPTYTLGTYRLSATPPACKNQYNFTKLDIFPAFIFMCSISCHSVLQPHNARFRSHSPKNAIVSSSYLIIYLIFIKLCIF